MTKIKAGHIGWGKGFLLSFGCYQKNEIGPDPDPDQIPAGTCGNQYVIAGMKPLPIYSPGLKIIFSYVFKFGQIVQNLIFRLSRFVSTKLELLLVHDYNAKNCDTSTFHNDRHWASLRLCCWWIRKKSKIQNFLTDWFSRNGPLKSFFEKRK